MLLKKEILNISFNRISRNKKANNSVKNDKNLKEINNPGQFSKKNLYRFFIQHNQFSKIKSGKENVYGKPHYSSDKYVLIAPAAAAAKLLQLCPTLCDPIDGNPPGSPVLGILQARTLEWVPSPSPMYSLPTM